MSFLVLVFCLLMTTVFETSCPLPLSSCPSLPFSVPLTSNLLPRPPAPSSPPLLLFCPPLPPSPRCRFKQLALSAADTSSMQIESPPTLCLPHFLAVVLFSLPLRDYVVMRVSCLCGETFPTPLSFALTFPFSLLCAPMLLLSHAVPSLCLPPVSLTGGYVVVCVGER